MIEKKRVLNGDTLSRHQRGRMFKSRRCRKKVIAKKLLDYQTARKD